MFVGHYAASFAAKSVSRDLPLWLLFVAVQFVDYIWAILIILGIEKARFEHGFTEASPLDLYHMPYTHSLLGALVWSAVFAGIYLIVRRRSLDRSTLLVHCSILAAAVFSHWLTDLLVHVEDLPLISGDPKLGFGLWRNFWASQALEIGLMAVCFIWYLRTSNPKSVAGRILPWVMFGGFAVVQATNHILPAPPSMTAFAAQALVAYSMLAALAYAVERSRISTLLR